MPFHARIDVHFDPHKDMWIIQRDEGLENGPVIPHFWDRTTFAGVKIFTDELLDQNSGAVFVSDDRVTQSQLSVDEGLMERLKEKEEKEKEKEEAAKKGYLHSGQEPTQNQEQEPKEDHKKEPHQEQEASPHAGSTLESFLKEEGILEEVNAQVQLYTIKSTLSYMLKRTMLLDHVSKTQMAARMKTSRSQLDRVLDPNNTGVTLETLVVAAEAVGMRLTLEGRKKEEKQ